MNDREGRARCVLLATSDGTALQAESITTDDALRYLTTRTGQLWGFYFDYDVNFLLRDLPVRALNRLRQTGWTYHRQWRIHHIPRRLLEVWDREQRRYQAVYDVFPFVQTSFVRWLRDWRLADERTVRHVERMKEKRAGFAALGRDKIRTYTDSEVRLLEAGVRRLKDRVAASGYLPSRWLGPGAVAARALRQHQIRDHFPTRSVPGAQAAFYGGRIETGAVGLVRQPLWSYDINSAYPAAAAALPCFRHGVWRQRLPTARETALVRVRWAPRDGKRPVWGPFPCRPVPGAPLRYYAQGEGVYWWAEVEPWITTELLHDFRLQLVSGRCWEPDCEHRPMEWVRELYAKRQELKQRGDPAEYAYKLILNSLYGKLAQSVGTHPYRCIAWAGIITAETRRRIASILIQYSDRVLVVATDGVLLTHPLPIPASRELGEWTPAGEYQWADIWQPGFYVLSDGAVRTRGFTRREVDVDELRREWRRNGLLGKATLHRERLVGYRLATSQKRPDDFCRWAAGSSELLYWPLPRRDFDPDRAAGVWCRGEAHVPTRAPLSWETEPNKEATRQLAREWIASRQRMDEEDDGEPQGGLRD